LKPINGNITLDYISFSINDTRRQAYEQLAIKKAITYSKKKINTLINNTYPNKKYKILSIKVNPKHTVPIYNTRMAMDAVPESNVISQGKSIITVDIEMKIKLV
jgi:predicted secreted protein